MYDRSVFRRCISYFDILSTMLEAAYAHKMTPLLFYFGNEV